MMFKSAFRLITLFIVLVSPTVLAVVPSTVPPEGLRQNTPSHVALTNARIVQSSRRVIDRGSIVFKDGIITAVGADVAIPADARVVDCTGMTIYPGLIDAYVELPADASKIDPARGDTTARHWNPQVVPQIHAARLYKPDDKVSDSWRGQGVIARYVAPGYGIIRGTGALISTADGSLDRALLADDVAQHMQLAPDRGQRDRDYPNSPMGAYTLVRQAVMDAGWYRTAHTAADKNPALPRPEVNEALDALSRHLDRAGLVMIDAPDELYDLRTLTIAGELGLNLVIHGGGYEYRVVDQLAQAGVPVVIPVNMPKPPNVGSPERARSVTLESLMHWDLAPESPARLDKASVPILLSSEGLKKPDEFLDAIRTLINRGLDKGAAIDALTDRPAQLYGVGDRLGTLDVGKSASLLIVRGDLFEKDGKILDTWIDGKRYPVSPVPPATLAGRYELSGLSKPITLTVTGEAPKLSATIEVDMPATQPASTQPTTRPSVKAGNVELIGTRVAGTFKGDNLGIDGVVLFSVDVVTGSGQAILPDGTRQPLTLATPGASTQPTSQPTSQPTTQPAASYEPNWPLGAYGRSGLPEQQTVLFQNFTIWPSDGRKPFVGSVLIRKGMIAKVAEGALDAGDATVIDGQDGKLHLTPGIIDCHSHIATDGGINESGQAITCDVRIGDFINPCDIDIYRQLAGGVTSSNILHGSANPIGGQNQVIKLRWGGLPEQLKFVEAPPGVKMALGENVKQSNWGDEYNTRYPQSRMGVEQIMNDALRSALDYEAQWSTYRADPDHQPMPRRDLKQEALLEIVKGIRRIHCHSYRQDEILALLRTCERMGIKIATLQHILEGYKVADAIAAHGAGASTFSDWWAYKFEVFDAIPYNAALMYKVGVNVSLNSDDGEMARRLNLEAAKAVKYGGVPPEDALCMVTRNPAQQLGIDDYVGTITEGKQADLVVWAHSPLSIYTRCEQTWIDGRRYFSRDEDAKAQAEVNAQRAALIQKVLASGEKPAGPDESPRTQRTLWPTEDLFDGD